MNTDNKIAIVHRTALEAKLPELLLDNKPILETQKAIVSLLNGNNDFRSLISLAKEKAEFVRTNLTVFLELTERDTGDYGRIAVQLAQSYAVRIGKNEKNVYPDPLTIRVDADGKMTNSYGLDIPEEIGTLIANLFWLNDDYRTRAESIAATLRKIPTYAELYKAYPEAKTIVDELNEEDQGKVSEIRSKRDNDIAFIRAALKESRI